MKEVKYIFIIVAVIMFITAIITYVIAIVDKTNGVAINMSIFSFIIGVICACAANDKIPNSK